MQIHTLDPGALYDIYDVKEFEDLIYDALIDDDPEESPLLVLGAPGIGKTAILKNAIDRLPNGKDWKLYVKTLSTETPDNFFLPKYFDNIAIDVPKDWLPVYRMTGDPIKDKQLDEEKGYGLLFIDELSRTTSDVQSVCLSLVHDRMFNGYKVGSHWKIICASNRMEDEVEGQTEISNALMSRFGVAYFEPTAKGWSKWAQTQPHISPLFLQWIQMAEGETMGGSKYFYWDPNHESNKNDRINKFCMPRTWDKAFRRLSKKHPSGNLMGFNLLEIPENTIKRILNLNIPSEAIGFFCQYLSTIKIVGNIKEFYDGVWNKGKFDISSPDLRRISLPLMQFLISSRSNSYPSSKEFENLSDWLVSMNNSSLVSYALDTLYNVFCPDYKNSQRVTLFTGPMRYKYLKSQNTKESKTKLEMYDEVSESFCKKWGFKNLGECPDWSVGFEKLINKYGEEFENFKINGEPALG